MGTEKHQFRIRGVLKTTFSTETGKHTISERFWCGFGYLLGLFGVTLVAKWDSGDVFLEVEILMAKKVKTELPGLGSNLQHLAGIWVPGPKE